MPDPCLTHVQTTDTRRLPVLRLDKVGEGLGLLDAVMAVVTMVVILGSDVLHLVDAAAFWAPLYRSLTRHLPGIINISSAPSN